jgi:hypothetical protein
LGKEEDEEGAERRMGEKWRGGKVTKVPVLRLRSLVKGAVGVLGV